MEKVKVWDPFVRIFHWMLVLAIIVQYASADSFPGIHVKNGYLIITLVLVRVVWGFVGTRHARFTDFLYPPREVVGYLSGLVKRQPKHYLGHNPAGGAMVLALLICLAVTAFAGLHALAEKGSGPFADSGLAVIQTAHANGDEHAGHGHDGGRLWGEIHEAMTGVMVFLIVLHVCGVIASSWVDRENLILAMITGKKPKREQ